MRHYKKCSGCGHKTMSQAVAAEKLVIYWERTRRDVPPGGVLCQGCEKVAQPPDQQHLFIAPPSLVAV